MVPDPFRQRQNPAHQPEHRQPPPAFLAGGGGGPGHGEHDHETPEGDHGSHRPHRVNMSAAFTFHGFQFDSNRIQGAGQVDDHALQMPASALVAEGWGNMTASGTGL